MKHPDKKTPVGVCQQLVCVEDPEDNELLNATKCDTIVDLNHLRATDWKCPMCGQKGDKEMWMPSAAGTIFGRVA